MNKDKQTIKQLEDKVTVLIECIENLEKRIKHAQILERREYKYIHTINALDDRLQQALGKIEILKALNRKLHMFAEKCSNSFEYLMKQKGNKKDIQFIKELFNTILLTE